MFSFFGNWVLLKFWPINLSLVQLLPFNQPFRPAFYSHLPFPCYHNCFILFIPITFMDSLLYTLKLGIHFFSFLYFSLFFVQIIIFFLVSCSSFLDNFCPSSISEIFNTKIDQDTNFSVHLSIFCLFSEHSFHYITFLVQFRFNLGSHFIGKFLNQMILRIFAKLIAFLLSMVQHLIVFRLHNRSKSSNCLS